MIPALLLAAFALHAAPPAATWPQWRGPTRDGLVAAGSPAWPNTLGEANFKKQWSVPDLGPSYSGPIVSATLVYTTQTVDKKTEVVTAYDRATGKFRWKQEWSGAMTVPFFAAKNGSWIRATPALDGDRLYVPGIQDLLVCLNANTGEVLWKYDFVKELATAVPAFGFVCSPLVDDTSVYVQAGGHFCKLDKLKGTLTWKTLKNADAMNGSAFSCPVMGTIAGKKQLVVQTRESLAGVDIDTGKELWMRKIPTFRGMNILTPVIQGDRVFTSTYGGTTQAFGVQAKGDTFSTRDGWSFKYEGYMTTPVVVGEYAYWFGKDRKAICANITTGKEAWRSEKSYGDYWNLVANGDRILALDSKGKLLLLNANPKEFELLGEVNVSKAETWAHLAVAGDDVCIRDLNSLTCFKWK